MTKIYPSSFQWLTAAILFYFAEKVMNTNDLCCAWKWWLNRPPGTLPCSSLLLYVSQLTPHYDVFSTDENHQANSDLRVFPLAVHFCPEFSSSRCLYSSLFLTFRPQLKCQTLQWSSYDNLIGNNSLITFYHALLYSLLGTLLAVLLCLNNLIDHDPTKTFNKHLQYGSKKINEIIVLKELTLK